MSHELIKDPAPVGNINTFIRQTAKDYDLPIEVIENIIKNHAENFYEKLEEYLMEQNEKR